MYGWVVMMAVGSFAGSAILHMFINRVRVWSVSLAALVPTGVSIARSLPESPELWLLAGYISALAVILSILPAAVGAFLGFWLRGLFRLLAKRRSAGSN